MASHAKSKSEYLETSIDFPSPEVNQENELINSVSDRDGSCDVYDHGDDYQGPHDWRRRLKPVQSPIHGENKEGDNWILKGQTSSRTRTRNREPLEDVKAQEKPKRIPSWKRNLIEKKKSKINLKRQGSGAGSGSQGSGIYRKKSFNRNGDSAFTQQVINGNQGRRKLSPSNSFKQASQTGSHLSKNRVAKVQRARLYLLQQAGPNSFLIGGDSPDHKFRVIIGPQTCSCGKGPHCVHVLFVMLRVFQISETDPLLWSKTLKNYEVETLFRVYHDKVSNRIRTKNEKIQEQKTESSKTPSPTNTPAQSEVDAESIKEEDDTCPICLLEMLEGESLLKCENGCGNRLHHHCIAIWFELCRRQHDPLICPLCRARWKSADVNDKSEHDPNQSEPPLVPPNTRAPSPQPARELRLPIPPEYASTAAPWIEVLGEDLISYFFSRDWLVRETGLKQLSKDILGVLMRGMGEGKTGAVVSLDRTASTHKMLETCCYVLAYMCADPVYRVFVASLRTLRTVLSYIPCSDAQQKERLETFLKPVVEAVIIKCTDGNRRTSQLSISTIVELAKGQDGELVIGKEVTGSQGLDSLDYIIKCVTEDYDTATVQWQWLLGRLYVLERLFEEFHNDLLPRNPPDGKSADEESSCHSGGAPCAENSIVKLSIPDRLLSIAKFCIKAITNAHMRVSRMARRVFLMVAKFSAHVDSMIEDLEEMLSVLEHTVAHSLKKRMSRIINDLSLSEKIVKELKQAAKFHNKLPSDSPFDSPFGTPLSTPRCNSPTNVSSHSDTVSEAGSSTLGKNLPLAPPNTPIRARRKCKYERKMERDLRELDQKEHSEHETDEMFINELKEITGEMHRICKTDNAEIEHDNNESNMDKQSPPPVQPQPPSRRGSYEILQEGPIVSPPHPPPDLINSCAIKNSDQNTEKKNKSETILDTSFVGNSCVKEDSFSFGPHENSYLEREESMAKDDAICECTGGQEPAKYNGTSEFQMTSTGFHTSMSTSELQTSMSISSDERTLSSDDSLDRSRKRMKQRKCFPTAEQGAMSSDEILDISPHRRSASSNDSFVTFKTEVATMTPKTSPNHTVENKEGDEICACKEEVDREEALALAKAMEVSGLDPPKPVVPGLTPTDKEEVITIRIQPDNHDKRSANDPNGNAPSLYLEGNHWVKGPLLGTGAYSTCYQARDVKSGVIMAVKQISFCRNSRTEQESVVESVTEEIIMMTKLNHPNVVRILGATRQGCHFNMFVEWMPGGSVAYLLSQYGAFSDNVITSYLLQILRGLAYLHEYHILHRDLKGANLLVDSTGQRLRIGDFGAAARLASQATGAGEFQGQLLGTIAFMAPEVLRGEDYGRACDVWSIGCIIIEMSTTLPPWNAKDVSNHLALIFKIATSMKPPPIPDNLSPPIRDILLRCLEQDKTERPSAKDLLLHPLFTQCMSK